MLAIIPLGQQNSFYFYLKKEVEHPQETDSIHQEPKSFPFHRALDIRMEFISCGPAVDTNILVLQEKLGTFLC